MASEHSAVTTVERSATRRRGSVLLRTLLPLALLAAAIIAVVLLQQNRSPGPEPTPAVDDAAADGPSSNDAAADREGDANGDGDREASRDAADDNASEDEPLGPAPETFTVRMGGETFELDTALTQEERLRGLSFREEIAPDGGMVFAFPEKQRQAFVMRDCLVPIDIAYLDDDGRIVNMYTMRVQPRREGESTREYERRLSRYPSAERVRLVVEFKAGTFKRLGVKRRDVIEGDFASLFPHAEPVRFGLPPQ